MPSIDDSHAPYKFRRSLGPGPKGRPPVRQTRGWVCELVKPSERGGRRGYYTQLCVNTETNALRLVRRDKKKKKRYNKVYAAWAASKRAKSSPSRPLPGYKCRPTRVARCGKKRRAR